MLTEYQTNTCDPHAIDGAFTGWSPGSEAGFEWSDVQPAFGRFTTAYFDSAAGRLWILNDWVYNDELPVLDHCSFSFFSAFF